MAEYDVVVIGSGPAGSVAAKVLVDKGLKVIILEQKKLPRYKMCSGMLFPGAQAFIAERYGDIPDEMFSHPTKWDGYKIFPSAETPLEQCMEVFFPVEPLNEPGLPQGLANIWRDRFDHWLAKQSGAELRDECTFKELLFEDNFIKIKALLQKKPIEMTAQYVIGADGGTSRARRAVFPEVDKKIAWFPCYEQWYHGTIDLDPNWFYGFLDPKFTAFYSGFYIKDDIFIQITSGREGDSVKHLHNNFYEHLKEVHNLNTTEVVAEYGIQINDMAPRDIFCLGKKNVLLAGEAAGFLYPFGEGITPAMITGEIAAQAIIKSIESNGEVIEQYSKMVEKEIERTRASHEFAAKAGMDVFG